jgi:hypothetical protein
MITSHGEEMEDTYENYSEYIPWGASKSDMKFIMFNKEKLISQTDSDISYFREVGDSRLKGLDEVKTFFFNDEGKLFKIVKKYYASKESGYSKSSMLSRFVGYNCSPIEYYALLGFKFGYYYENNSYYKIKWDNDQMPTGIESHELVSEKWDFNLDAFHEYIDLESLKKSTSYFDQYPNIEIHTRLDFENMQLESNFKQSEENPEVYVHEVVYTSTLLS